MMYAVHVHEEQTSTAGSNIVIIEVNQRCTLYGLIATV
jgi:hypothetical protein